MMQIGISNKPASLVYGYDSVYLFIPFTLITVATPAQTTCLSAFALQLQGPFSLVVQAGISLFPALCSV